MRNPANRRYFGGVVAFNKADFEAINGFPNTFWGWGGEDDEMYSRIVEVCNLTPKHGANRNLDVTGTGHNLALRMQTTPVPHFTIIQRGRHMYSELFFRSRVQGIVRVCW